MLQEAEWVTWWGVQEENGFISKGGTSEEVAFQLSPKDKASQRVWGGRAG